MAGTVVVQTTASGAGAPVAVEAVGGADYQLIKVVGGAVGDTTPVGVTSGVPGGTTGGLIVAVIPGASVTVQQGASVVAQASGTVSVSGPVQVSGAVSVSALPPVTVAGGSLGVLSTLVTLLGTIAVSGTVQASGTVSVSGPVQASGTVSLSGTGLVSVVPGVSVNLGSLATAVATTTASGASGQTGQLVWVGNPAAAQTTVVSGTVSVSNVVSVTGASISVVVSGSVALSGTGVVSVVPGVSVSLGGLANVVVTTTATSGVSGVQVWLGHNQTLATVQTLLGTVAVNVVAGGAGGGSVTTAPPSVSQSGQAIWVVGGQGTTANPVVVTGTVTAGAGTTVVSIGNVVPVTTAASVSVTGLPVWLNPTQQVVVSGLVGHSVTGSVNVVSTVLVTGSVGISGTGLVSVVPGVSVSLGSLATVVATTTGSGASGLTGLVVWVGNPGNGTTVISGTVSLSGTQVVTLATGGSVTLVGSVGASIVAAVSVSSITPVTTQTSVSVSGLPVWFSPGALVSVSGTAVVSVVPGVSVVAQASGTVTVLGVSATTAGPSISATGIVVWVGGGQGTTATPVVVTGTVTAGAGTTVVSVQGAVPVTTQTSVSVTGLPVWFAPGALVSLSGTGVVSVVPGVSVSVNVVNTIVTVLSTVNVAIVAGAGGGGSVTTAGPSVTATGQVMWVAGGQSAQTNPVWVSGSVALANVVGVAQGVPGASGVQVYLAGGVPYAVGGVSVTGTTVSTVLAANAIPFYFTTASVATTMPGVIVRVADSVAVSGTVAISIPVSQALGTVITVLGTQVVTLATGGSVTLVGTVGASVIAAVSISSIVPVTTAASVSVAGFPVWLNPTQTVVVSNGTTVVSGTVSVLGAGAVSSPASGVTGMAVWPGVPVFQPVMMMVTSTAIAVSANFYAMTVWTNGTVVAAGTTAWAVPAGKNFRLLNIQAVMTTSAVVGGTVQFIVCAATATASQNSASFRTQGFQALIQGVVTALPVAVGPLFVEADTPAATTIGLAIVASTAAVLQNVIVQGYLF